MSTLLRRTFAGVSTWRWRDLLVRLRTPLPTPPTLYYSPTPLTNRILARCQLLRQQYVPTAWMSSAHAQTILCMILRAKTEMSFITDTVQMSDGGQIALDMFDAGCDANSPIVVFFPGLSGSSESRYIRQLVATVSERRCRSVVFHYRGVKSLFTTAAVSTGCDVSDVECAIRTVHRRFPSAPIILCGVSMGANMMTKALGMIGEHAKTEWNVAGAVSISNAFDFVRLSASLEDDAFNQLIYSRFLAFTVKRNVFRSKHNRDVISRVVDVKSALTARTIRELDDRLTRNLYGIDSVTAYYDSQSSIYWLQSVGVPLLCLNALDDPFAGVIPYDSVKLNSNIILAVTDRGGHVGWSQGNRPWTTQGSYMIGVTKEFIDALLDTQ